MDVLDLVAKIRLDDSEYEDGVGKAKSTFSSLASGIGKGLATVAKVGAAAVSAGAAGVVALTKMGVEGYAQYEQLVGGVETLFKESADIVQTYAANAYKTSGLSANAYMETVTSFSASLIQSLDGDTTKAAQVADKAITDMSDNANKMGTSIEMIQNAYNGFAKGNFTMLDNLKLGYGGTKEEMQRLLQDAQKISGIKYDISSFADIAEAIHVIQEDLGIAGATAAEAATTIEGSLSMMKASWENLVVGMADENADMTLLINNFVDSTITAADNIMPRVEQTLVGIGMLVEGLAPIIADKLPSMVSSILPALLNAAVSLVSSVVNALPGLLDSLLPVVITAGFDVIMALITVFRDNSGLLIRTGIDALLQLVDGITSSIPVIIEAGFTLVSELVQALTEPDTLQKLFDAALLLLEEIVTGLIDNLPILVDAALLLIQNLVTFITTPGNLEKLIQMAVTLIMTIMDGLVEAIPQLVQAAIQIIVGLAEFLLDPGNISTLVEAALQIVIAIAEGLIKASGELVRGALQLITDLDTTFKETDWAALGIDMIDKILSGMSGQWSLMDTWLDETIKTLKAAFDFEWSLPNLKLPHLSVSGGEAPWGIGGKGSLPSFNIEWYSKAYDNAMVLSSPTIFGYSNGSLLAGGEGNGNEIVAGESHLLGLIGSVVEAKTAAQNAKVVSLLAALLEATTDGNAEMIRALADGHVIQINDRELGRAVRSYA